MSVSAIGGKLLSLGKAAGLQILGGAGLAKLFADAGSELNDMSARTGLSVEALSQLGYAAKQTGTDLGTVEAAVRKMQKSLVGAANGNFEAQAALSLLGLSAEKLLRLSPDEQFQAIAKAMAAIPDPTMKAALAMQLFGKGGTAILPLIDDFDALTGKARDLGLVMSSEDAAAADALGDAIDTVSASLRRAVNVIGGAMAPALTFVADRISETVKVAADWIAANRGLVQILAAVVPGAVALGAAMVALGPAISAVGIAIGALASPMVVVIGLAAGLGSVLVQTSGVAAEAFGWLSERLGELLADARSAFQGIADALAAGDIGLAAKVLWSELKLEWVKGVSFLRKIWLDFSSAFRDVFADAVRGIAGIIIDLGAKLQEVLARVNIFDQGNLDAKLAQIEQDRRVAQGALDDELQARRDATLDAYGKEREQLEKEISDARARLAQVRGEARDAAGRAFGDPPGGKPGTPGGKPGTPGVDLPDLDAAIGEARRKVDVAGSFSASALRGLGAGSSVANDQLKEQQKQTKLIERLNERLRNARVLMED
jgi:hypothetical protein